MNVQRIVEAAEAIGWLSNQASTLDGTSERRTRLVAELESVELYLLAYADRVASGMTSFEAIEAAVAGQSEVDPAQDA